MLPKINTKNISLVGLGKLGLPLAACFSNKGFNVVGIDTNKKLVNLVNKGYSPIQETGLQNLLSKTRGSLTAYLDHSRAIEETDITIVLVATPSNAAGRFSNKYLNSALKSLSEALKNSSKSYHLFIISSTVMPGSIEKKLVPIIEKFSGRRLDRGFGAAYVPDFVKLGSVIDDFYNPDFLLIGESNKFAGDITERIYKKMIKNKPPVHRTSLINTELAKVSLNCYLTTKISFANTLANVCEKIPGASVDTITNILGSDKRISPHYLKGALAFGGTCFPRDTRAFIALSKRIKYKPYLISAIDKVNEFQNKHLANIVLRTLKRKGIKGASILGLSFKPGTPVIQGSPAIPLINSLLKNNIRVYVYDPLAIKNTKEVFGNVINYSKSLDSCLSHSNLWVITSPDPIFKKIEHYKTNKKIVIIDCWRIIKSENLNKNFEIYRIGIYDDKTDFDEKN